MGQLVIAALFFGMRSCEYLTVQDEQKTEITNNTRDTILPGTARNTKNERPLTFVDLHDICLGSIYPAKN